MSLKEGWVLHIDSTIDKTLKKIPRRDAELVLFGMRELAIDPFRGDVKKKKVERGNIWRKRVGSYRIFYEILSRAYSQTLFSNIF